MQNSTDILLVIPNTRGESPLYIKPTITRDKITTTVQNAVFLTSLNDKNKENII